jgi:hypothetical protein
VLNCGTEGAVVVEKIGGDQDPNFGFNASTRRKWTQGHDPLQIRAVLHALSPLQIHRF